MNKIINYVGLYGEINARPDTNYIFSELLETRSRTFNWVINPHIHSNLYQIFFVATGEVTFKEATKEYLIQAPCVLFIPPTMLHGLVYSPETTGRILTISENVVDALMSISTAISVAFGKIQRLTQFDSSYPFHHILQLVEQIDAELFSDRPEKKALLSCYLHQLIIVLYRVFKLKEEENSKQENITLEYFRQFQKRIKTAEYDKPIPEYAQELGITPVHLNRICKAVADKTALDLVQEHLIEEAQKYLRYTSYSVSEIAYLLKFEYPNYFAKLFKKHTGHTPKEFRAQR